MTWLAIDMRTSAHVVPQYEEGHVLSLTCWCDPIITQEEDYRCPVVTHRDPLDREYGEL